MKYILMIALMMGSLSVFAECDVNVGADRSEALKLQEAAATVNPAETTEPAVRIDP